MRRHFLIVTSIALVTLWVAVGAGCKPRHFETEADLLRAQVLDLETQVDHLERREAELRSQLRRMRRAQDRLEDMDEPDIGEFVPQVVDITVGRLSHVRDTARDGWPDTLLVYVHPRDSRGRFVQMVGEVHINAIILPEAEDAITIGRERLGPGQVRDAYRSGITGTHYAIEVPVSLPEGADLGWVEQQQAIVRVTFIDGQSGLRHTAERAIDLRR